MSKNFVSPDEVRVIPALPGFSVVHLCPFDRRLMTVPVIAWSVVLEAQGDLGERVVTDCACYPPIPIFLSSSSLAVGREASVMHPNGVVVDPGNDVHYHSVDQWELDQLVYVWIQVDGSNAVDGEISYRDFVRFERAFEEDKLDSLGDVFIKGGVLRLSLSSVQAEGQGALRLCSLIYEHPDQVKNDVPRLVFRRVG